MAADNPGGGRVIGNGLGKQIIGGKFVNSNHTGGFAP